MSETQSGSSLPSSLLRNPNFLLLWCAYAVSAMGDHISEMAILKTQNALSAEVDITPLYARMTFVLFIPFLVFAPVAGLLADRLPRRAIMIAADVARFLLFLSFAQLVAWTRGWGGWGVFLPLLLVGIFSAAFSPARSALLPTLIRPRQIVRANGLLSGLGIIATMAAAGIGGHLADQYQATVAFQVDAATFAMSAVFLAFMRGPSAGEKQPSVHDKSSSLTDLANGFRYAVRHRHVRELLLIATLIWFCAPLVNCVIPAIVRDVYGGTYTMISSYRVLLGLGFIVGAILITTFGDALRSEIAISWSLIGIAMGAALFAASVFLPLAVRTLATIGGVGVVITGVFGVGVIASFNALLQKTVADRYRGRVFGVRDVATTAALLLATGGLVGVSRGTRMDPWVGWILVGVSLAMFFAGCVTLLTRLRRSAFPFPLILVEHLNEFVAKFWWRLQRLGPSTLPHKGPVILTANHRCSPDPLFLSALVPYRAISFMVAEEYTHWPIVGFVTRTGECIPVKRDGQDTAATKQAIRLLRAGKALGIFIEGRIVRPGEVGQPKDGVAMLALRTGAKVIPAYISGTTHHSHIVLGLLIRHRARVRLGPPVDLSDFAGPRPSRSQIAQATQRIYASIQALAPENITTSEKVSSKRLSDKTNPVCTEPTHE